MPGRWPSRVEENCDLWFVTPEDSTKVHEIEKDTRAHVVCQKGWTSCVSISGRASLSRDRAQIRRLWKEAYQVWFPDGEEDPNIVLIQFRGEQGEYWHNTGTNRFTYTYRALKALATGTKPEIIEGEQHGQAALR
jgi:general stress protein 26